MQILDLARGVCIKTIYGATTQAVANTTDFFVRSARKAKNDCGARIGFTIL